MLSSWTTKNFMLSLADCKSSDHTGYTLSLSPHMCVCVCVFLMHANGLLVLKKMLSDVWLKMIYAST